MLTLPSLLVAIHCPDDIEHTLPVILDAGLGRALDAKMADKLVGQLLGVSETVRTGPRRYAFSGVMNVV